MKKSKLAMILTASYLTLASSIIYELSIRISDTSNSELVGLFRSR